MGIAPGPFPFFFLYHELYAIFSRLKWIYIHRLPVVLIASYSPSSLKALPNIAFRKTASNLLAEDFVLSTKLRREAADVPFIWILGHRGITTRTIELTEWQRKLLHKGKTWLTYHFQEMKIRISSMNTADNSRNNVCRLIN